MMHLTVIPIGAQIELAPEIKAAIIGIQILGTPDHPSIEYECAWFHGGARHNVWITQAELGNAEKATEPISSTDFEQPSRYA